MSKKKHVLSMILAVLSVSLLIGSCNISTSGKSGSGNGDTDEDYSEVDLTSAWTAYNDCVASATGNDPNATQFDWNDLTDPMKLKDFSDGSEISVIVSIDATNVTGWDLSGVGKIGMPLVGTDANDTFDGIINLNNIASYDSGDWHYQITFSNLDPTKSYAFVTTANRDDIAYEGNGSASRWTKFTISGADTYRNVSSSGVTEVSEAVLKLNTGYNSENGYVVAWTDITAADSSFTVRSENVGATGPGEQYKSYGLQGFMFKELAE
jgi:hypothetical protein